MRTTESKANSQANDIVTLEKKTQLPQLMLEVHKDRAEEKTPEMQKNNKEEKHKHQRKEQTVAGGI